MKPETQAMKTKTRKEQAKRRTRIVRRRGSTLLIVMVLMGMLSLLGVLFYTFSAQERSNAEYYSEAAKEHGEPSLDADVLFDFALEQIIVGTNPQFKNSMLWGSRHSLLSNALGFGLHKPGDLHPFNGEGVNVIFDGAGNVAVDQNRNGLPDDGTAGESDNRYLLLYNDSPAAQNEDFNKNGNLDAGEDLNNNGQLDVLVERPLTAEDLNGNGILDAGEDTNGNGVLDRLYPQSDVGYTYPDINNAFLCYVSKVRDQNGNVHQVVKPSYLVPGILRNAGGAPNTNWYQDATTASRSMRAHPNHLFVPVKTSSGITVNRYLTNAEATSLLGPTGYGFPFAPMANSYRTAPATAPTGTAYLTGKMGAYSKLSATPAAAAPNGDDPIEFDYDNDGDSFRESILMDLGHCVRSDASGKKYVPMFLITIHDLDSLINLNAHGNLAKILFGPNDASAASTSVSNTANPFGWDTSGTPAFYSISQSNLGMGPSEVNPFWALNARYGTDGGGAGFTQHQAFFGSTPTLLSGANPPWGETANMELLWAKIGRPQSSGASIADLYPGVYGEEGRLYQAITGGSVSNTGGQTLPRPGTSLQDDNGDVYEGQSQAASTADPFPSFIHPLDYTGLGSYLSNASPKQINWSTSGANRWIAYNRYGSNIATPSASSNVKWGQKSGLMTNTLTQGLGDDPNEVGIYAEDKRDIDNIFKPDEMLYLQLNKTEVDRLNVSTRLSKLLPFNFSNDTTAAGNTRGVNIRKKFTTLSNDRKSFGLPSVSAGTTGYGRAWEFSIDSTSGKSTFPPQFGTIARFATTALAEDPFRQAVRYLLEIEKEGTQPTSPRLQRKLSLNQLLTGASSSQIDFRTLTPHPEDPGAATINSVPNVTAYPPTITAGYEYWARRDRQQMARDIYVLLYLLGHGNDATNTATTAYNTAVVYTDAQLAEMAHFAVNLVDAMDRDDIITRFEYDKDLSNGWNLDDDAYTTSGESDRAEVFGVERLDLTISEALAIQAKQATSMSDHASTNYNEGSANRHFAYVELRNHGPFDITFDSKEAWQVVLKQDAIGANPAWERRMSLKSGTIASGAIPYVIGSTDAGTAATMFKRSTFAVDPTWSGSPVQLAPNGKDCDLDLVEATPPTTFFRIEDESNTDVTGTVGSLLSAFTGPTPTGNVAGDVKFVLRRRAHLTRSRVTTTTDNPWVEVDSMTLTTAGTTGSPAQTFRSFDAGASPTAATIAPRLGTLTSLERNQPLDATTTGQVYHPATTPMASTIGANNSNIVSPFNIWQPHFDRDFASVMDLLLLPVCGPDKVTAYMKGINKETPQGQLSSAAAVAKSAAAKFLLPEHPDNVGLATLSSADRLKDNRWHRLLEFLEVPTRTNRNMTIGTDISIPRVPGRMNLNTFRYADNFAALLDDSRNLTFKIDGTNPAGAAYHQVDADAGELYDQFEGTARDWWDQFLKSRDRIDPYWSGTVSVPLPGLPGSNPFRSLAEVGYTASGGVKHASVESTVLRSLPADTAVAGSKRRLLEIGNAAEHSGGSVDPYIRNRLLAKIAGNTTTRSNSFAIFISVKYFQAVEDNTTNPSVPAIRIGGPLNGLPEPEHRGFFIVDRSKLEKGQVSGGTRYDFRDFVEYRKTLQTQ